MKIILGVVLKLNWDHFISKSFIRQLDFFIRLAEMTPHFVTFVNWKRNDNDMLSYLLTTMMCFLTKEWYGFSAYTVNLFVKAYHKITYKEDLKIT